MPAKTKYIPYLLEYKAVEVSNLLGNTLTDITDIQVSKDKDEIIFVTATNEKYRMYHQQDCCEYVKIEDICGDLKDLIGSPIVLAEEVTNSDLPAKKDQEHPDYTPPSYTWTFYKFSTNKGSVTIRWYGTSNGCYSERAKFECLTFRCEHRNIIDFIENFEENHCSSCEGIECKY